MDRFNALPAEFDTAFINKALSEIESSQSCSDSEKSLARRATANRLFRLAYRGVKEGMEESEIDALLQQSEAVAPTWRTLSYTATRDHDHGRYNAAARRFQSALALIDDRHETPKPPSVETIAQLHQLASEALLLADEYVPPPRVRGVVSGVLAERVRGFSVQRAPLPIRFETGKTDFTVQGELAAESLLQALKSQSQTLVKIVGHADERGDSDFNYRLSLQRAQKVRDWLRQRGLERDIEVSGRGEQEPLVLNDPNRYSEQQRWQLNRRVELVRAGQS